MPRPSSRTSNALHNAAETLLLCYSRESYTPEELAEYMQELREAAYDYRHELVHGPRHNGSVDPRLPADAETRVGRQQQAILERLRCGPATNLELSAIGLRYSSRISELRHQGFDIRTVAAGQGIYFSILHEPPLFEL